MVEDIDPKCPLCGDSMILGVQEGNGEPLWYCQHGELMFCFFYTEDNAIIH